MGGFIESPAQQRSLIAAPLAVMELYGYYQESQQTTKQFSSFSQQNNQRRPGAKKKEKTFWTEPNFPCTSEVDHSSAKRQELKKILFFYFIYRWFNPTHLSKRDFIAIRVYKREAPTALLRGTNTNIIHFLPHLKKPLHKPLLRACSTTSQFPNFVPFPLIIFSLSFCMSCWKKITSCQGKSRERIIRSHGADLIRASGRKGENRIFFAVRLCWPFTLLALFYCIYCCFDCMSPHLCRFCWGGLFLICYRPPYRYHGVNAPRDEIFCWHLAIMTDIQPWRRWLRTLRCLGDARVED